jgi:hypothetical protein
MQMSGQIRDSSDVATEASSRSGYQPNPTASMALGIFSSPVSENFQDQVSPDPTIDNHFIVMHGVTTHAAFLRIAEILQLACMQDSGFNINAPTCTLPPDIAPTLQQQIVPHKPYVDMLPWSSLRDRMLNSLMAINEVEFLLDMASGDLKVWGSTPWDPMGWEVGPNFARKWWFLMDDGIMHTTNFWRGQRGEEGLVLASFQHN